MAESASLEMKEGEEEKKKMMMEWLMGRTKIGVRESEEITRLMMERERERGREGERKTLRERVREDMEWLKERGIGREEVEELERELEREMWRITLMMKGEGEREKEKKGWDMSKEEAVKGVLMELFRSTNGERWKKKENWGRIDVPLSE